ncbi:MAG: Flp pilus assembly protein CpaB [Chloroflexi bacterium]|nr:Flp pilus assembly protein CpaB [Chloroflexota bacterium]MBV9598757.1 Flp pilus assembly protein CpaB [Chloroflexota bacterium]
MINRPTPARKRRGLRLLIALALAGAAAGGVYMYAGSLQDQMAAQQVAQAATSISQSSVSVLVARSDIPANVPLTADLFDVKSLPPDTVAPGAATSVDQLAGKVLSSPMANGEQLLSSRLTAADASPVKTFADQIPPGTRAMSLSFTELGGAAGLVVPGSHVDVLGVFKKDVLGKDESMIMIQDVLVLAVAQSTAPSQLPLQPSVAPTPGPSVSLPGSTTPKPTATPDPRFPVAPPETRTVTLAVTPEAAERLALAESFGNLRYIIRPTGEANQNSVVPADLGTLASPLQAASAQIIATEISPTNVKVGDTINVSVTVKNTSDKPLQTMGPAPGFTYVQGQTYYTQQFEGQPGTWRVAVGTAGLDSTQLPYRWGLGGDLAPGATTTVTGQIKVTSDFKATNFWAAVVQEPANVVQDGAGMTLVTSLPENMAVIAVDAANVRSGPSIASSVVGQLPYGTQVQIVGQSADWLKIKMPDQTEAWVAAGWIVAAGR